MASNPYVNKVVFNNNTLIDLSSDTVTASKLAQGYTAHSASGAQITGTMPEGGGGEYDIEGTTLASGGQQLDITDAGGGSSITVEPITITQNGTTTAPSGKAYSPITTNVPTGVDVSSDTVTASTLLSGYTAHQANGQQITGTCNFNSDTSSDTVTANKLLTGYTAHNSAGQTVTGTCNYNCNTSSDTVTADKLANGYTAHNSAGQAITGTMSSVTVNSLSVTENGTYTAPEGTAYSPVTVNVSGGGGGMTQEQVIQTITNTPPVAPFGFDGTTFFSGAGTVSSGELTAFNTSGLNLNSSLVIGGFTSIYNSALYNKFYNNTSITSVSLPTVTTIKQIGMKNSFMSCTNLRSVSFPLLTSVENQTFMSAFNGCRSLTSVEFPLLTTLSGNAAFATAFQYCSNLTTISFPSLTTFGSSAFTSTAFKECTNLTSIHFKASVRSAVEAATGYSSKFGATNATIYFDL